MKMTKKAKTRFEEQLDYYKDMHKYYWELHKDVLQQEYYGAYMGAIAVNGEPRLTSRAIYTPSAVDEYGNVTGTAIVTVPKGCCFSVSVRYVDATTDDATTEPTPLIETQNMNLVINRIA